MKRYLMWWWLSCFFLSVAAQSGGPKIDAQQFFQDEAIIRCTIAVNMNMLLKKKMKEGLQFPAYLTMSTTDSTELGDPVLLEARGNYRRETCFMPPLKIIFKHPDAKSLSPLGSLKLVNVCMTDRRDHAEFLLKEYLSYKIYNLITPRSFRVRLMKVSFVDSSGRYKPINEWGFLLEDIKDMAGRNGCVERKRPVKHTEASDREQMTRVALFEYMIGNTDWSVAAKHNIKLIVSKGDTNAIPLAVPYDFDHSGLVKTDYALPPPQLEITDVTQRSYQGFARSYDELQQAADDFLSKKEAVYNLVNGFELLPSGTRKEMVRFLKDFFDIISKPTDIKAEFIRNARSN